MSIIRLSAVRDALYAPDQIGNLIKSDYDPVRRMGYLGGFDEDSIAKGGGDAQLIGHLKSQYAEQAAALPLARSIVVMANGFMFDPALKLVSPREKNSNPLGSIFHFDELPVDHQHLHHTTSWPRALGMALDDQGAKGLAVAFGWNSFPGLFNKIEQFFTRNFYVTAYEWAQKTTGALAAALRTLALVSGGWRAIDLMCHSLGSVLVLQTLRRAAEADAKFIASIDRVLVLDGAEYQGEAVRCLKALEDFFARHPQSSGLGPRFYNVANRNDETLDQLGERFGPEPGDGNRETIGHNGLGATGFAKRWMDLQIDRPDYQKWALDRGFAVFAHVAQTLDPLTRDHWVCFTDPGNQRVWGEILNTNRATWSFAALRDANPIPEGVAVDPDRD